MSLNDAQAAQSFINAKAAATEVARLAEEQKHKAEKEQGMFFMEDTTYNPAITWQKQFSVYTIQNYQPCSIDQLGYD